jgi:hypothetical protein
MRMGERRTARRALGAVALAGAVAAMAGPAEAERAGAAQGAGGRGTSYGGHTMGERRYPVVLWLSADRTAIARVVTAHHAPCTSGLAFNLVDNGPPRWVVQPDGRFRAVREPDPFDLDKGITARARVTITGRIKGRKVAGTVALHVDEKDPSGVTVATCDSTAAFRARSAPGRVYAGATSQNGPVVLELDRRREQVAHLRVGWQSVCESGAEFQVADHQVDFDLVRKRFGDEYDAPPYDIDGGGQGTDHYLVRGRVANRRKAAGVFRVTTDERDAAGEPADACDSGRLTFRARSG